MESSALGPCLTPGAAQKEIKKDPGGRVQGEGSTPYTAPGAAAWSEALPDHTAPMWHFQASVSGVPRALGDEPRVPVCSELLGTG